MDARMTNKYGTFPGYSSYTALLYTVPSFRERLDRQADMGWFLVFTGLPCLLATAWPANPEPWSLSPPGSPGPSAPSVLPKPDPLLIFPNPLLPRGRGTAGQQALRRLHSLPRLPPGGRPPADRPAVAHLPDGTTTPHRADRQAASTQRGSEY